MNKNKLLAVLAAHGETQKVLAEALGMSRVTLSKKINDRHSTFTQPEISIIKERYNLNSEELTAIFFAN